MLLAEERQAIADYGRKLITSQLTVGSSGNLSIFNRDQGLIAIKPSGVDYLSIRAEDVPVIRPDGQAVEGRLKASSEILFHLALYHHRLDVQAVVHTHQVYATTLACLNWELPAVHYLVAFCGNKVPLAPYAPFGSQALADQIVQTIGDYNACLMANHGLVTVGPSLQAAFSAAEEIEFVARVYYQAKCIGEPRILTDEEMNVVMRQFKTYGQNSRAG